MVDLLNLQPSTISRNLKGKYMMIFGLPKTGKTTFASEIPGHLICSFEPGTNALVGKMIAPMDNWVDFKRTLNQLKLPQVQEKFDVICIDTADKAYEACEKFICTQNSISSIGDLPWGKGYDLVKKEFSNAFDTIARLGYGLCFISHSTEKRFKDEKGDEYIQIAPALPARPYDIINKLVDIIGYIRVKKDPNTGDSIGRLYFRGDDNFLAGSRFKYIADSVLLSKNREFYYKNVENAILDAIDKEIEIHGSVAVTDEHNSYFDKKPILDYHQLMTKARNLWTEKVGDNSQKAQTVLELVEKIMGKPMKISEIQPEQVELLDALVKEMENID